jgi:hypothetical protein
MAARARRGRRARHPDLADLHGHPSSYRNGLAVRGKDYVYAGASGGRLSNMKNEFTGCGPFSHDDPQDRPRRSSAARQRFTSLPTVTTT